MKKIVLSTKLVSFLNEFSKYINVLTLHTGKIVILLLIIGSITQFIFTGSGILLHLLFVFITVVAVMLSREFIKKEFKRNLVTLIFGLFAAIIMGTIYVRPMDRCMYTFIDGQPENSFPFIRWNPLFKRFHYNIKGFPNNYCFNISTIEGGFQVNHECVAYINDAKTWQIFNLDKKKLYKYIRKDAQERIVSLLKQSCTQGSLSAIKVFYYKNGKCIGAKMEPREMVVRN